jgi:hypothetical protein
MKSGEAAQFSVLAHQMFRNVSSGGVESAERVPMSPAMVTPTTPPANPVSHIQGLKV